MHVPLNVPAFTGKIENSGAPSIKEAPQGTFTPQENVYLDAILADNYGWIGAPSDDMLYMMDMETYGTTTIGSTCVDPASGDFANNEFDVMYVAGAWGASLYHVDVATGAATLIGPFSGAPFDVSGMATDRTTGDVYVCGTNVSASFIGILDPMTGAISQIGSNITNAPALIDIAITGDGTLIGWCIVTDNSYVIDKSTGVATLLGSLGFDANYGQGGNWDPNDDIIYMTAYNSAAGAQLRALDPNTGSSTLLGGLPSSQCAAFGVPGGGGGAGSWLTLDYYENTVAPLGGLDNVPTNFDAAGTSAGEVYTADLIFTSVDPHVGTITIPCTMIIAGDPLVPPTDLIVELIDDLIGTVELTWTWTTDAFQFFIVKRDGVPIGTSTTTSYIDTPLPDYGTYCYTVQSFYDEGYSVPTEEVCVEWSLPEIFINPDFHAAEVWVDHQYIWTTTIYNNGIGTLAYEFPAYNITDAVDYASSSNQTGSPIANEDLVPDKSIEDQYSGTGYDVTDGFGGPDPFGYAWIDSDEVGGPTYNWIDISATGTLVTGLADDNIVGPFPVGFTFPFYGEDKSQFWLNSNGTIGFKSTYISLTNYSIPTGNTNTDFIAWFWDDLDPGNTNTSVWYQAFDNMLVIQFDTYYEYPDGNNYVNAQVQMFSTGYINILYDYITPASILTVVLLVSSQATILLASR